MPLRSYTITQGRDRAPARSMLKAIGFTDEDLRKPIIGIANTWIETMPCNYNLRALAEKVKEGIRAAGGTPMEFNTIAISDGITMGTEGMKASLVSRDLIADSIELTARGYMFDGIVAMVACDKTIPGAAMALLRLNVPSLVLYGGSILPGKLGDRELSIQDVFEAVGANAAGKISDQELLAIEDHACPGAGACGGQFTANTMATVMEAIGIAPMFTASIPQVDPRKNDVARRCGEVILDAVKRDLKPRDICNRQAFENATASVAASGGSTNAVLHLLAMADAANVRLSLDDFNRICKRTPVLADLKPSGKYVMADLVRIGGTVPLMKMLLDAGLLHGDCMTVTGRTMRENLEKLAKPYPEGQQIIRPLDNPVKKDSHLRILYGNLAEGGAVAKISGKEGEVFTGNARCFDSEDAAMKSILAKEIHNGDVIVIRMEGPKGGPGMREMLGPTSAIMGLGLGKDVALITDGRFSGGSHGFVVGHITPEAFTGGAIGLLKDGDPIIIDAVNNRIDVRLPDEELKDRRAVWKQPAPRYTQGVLAKYAKLVATASEGAVTDKYL